LSAEQVNMPRVTAERADLLQRMLRYCGKQRISAPEAMRHPMLARCFPADAMAQLQAPHFFKIHIIYF
jgi:hypothetical protein